MQRNVPTVRMATPIAALQDMLISNPCAVVVDDERQPAGIVTKIDLVDWLMTRSR
jgi:predicted transcriptional regulator